MEFFIDTADVEAIRKANDMGFISGVTTNPSLIAKEGKDFHAVIKEIASIVDGPISAEVLADDAEGMIAEGQVLAGLDPHVVVKVPMTPEGMKAVKGLKKLGIRTNVTLVFSANQALLAARAGASFVRTAWNSFRPSLKSLKSTTSIQRSLLLPSESRSTSPSAHSQALTLLPFRSRYSWMP